MGFFYFREGNDILDLPDFFNQYPKAALALSGGVDSTYLLYAAKSCGCDLHAYFAASPFQPAFEQADAQRMASLYDVPLTVLPLDVLSFPSVVRNANDRCYHCKYAIFSRIREAAQQDGYDVLLDGTNASDQTDDRPGMQALAELGVRSPLRECGITKPMVRDFSRQAGIFTSDKPAYACLATRIPTGTPVTLALLQKIERGENFLFSLGLTDFRLRTDGSQAKLQVPAAQMPLILQSREKILQTLSADFQSVVLDLSAR